MADQQQESIYHPPSVDTQYPSANPTNFPPPGAHPQYPYPPGYPPYPYPPPGSMYPPHPYFAQPPYPPIPATSTPPTTPNPVSTPPTATSAQSPPQPDSVSTFFNKVAHSIFVTKQKVLELTGQARGTIDPELQNKIEKLKSIHEQYERLEVLAKQLLNNFKTFSESVKLIGDHFYETGVKEAGPLADPLRQSGELHRSLEKQSLEFINSLTKLVDVVSTFKGAAVEDTMVNLQRYTTARQEYDGALLNLHDAKMGANPNSERISEGDLLAQESKKLMEKLGEDLNTKVIMLNEKRVQDLSVRLSEYVASLQTYYTACNRLMDDHPVSVSDESTAEFKALMGGQ